MQPEGLDRLFATYESLTNLERNPDLIRLYRLDRMERFLVRLGHPEHERPVVHIAGSKGKGSTAAYLTSMLAASGLRVGLYTSPHVTTYRERFTVVGPGEVVGGALRAATVGPGPESSRDDATLLVAGESIWRMVEEMRAEGVPDEELPTTFELLTALAFRFFADAGCDWVVLETGLGGRLDATNVCLPQLCILTRIELEHTDYLGDTIAAIAGEKAGIIKPGVPALVTPQREEARAVFERVARERGAALAAVEPFEPGDEEGSLRLPQALGATSLQPAMRGVVQRTNAAAALAAWHALHAREAIPGAKPELLARAIRETCLPGRGERIADLLLDGAHTPESVAQVVASLPSHATPRAVIFGAVAGKDYRGMARALRTLGVPVVVSRPGTFKPGDPPRVARELTAEGLSVTLEPDPAAALSLARSHAAGATILVTGSFYMVAEIRRLVIG